MSNLVQPVAIAGCIAAFLSACVIGPLHEDGKSCPCPTQYQCDQELGYCVSSELDLSVAAPDLTAGGLIALVPSAGALVPAFDPTVPSYRLVLPLPGDLISFTPTENISGTTILVDSVLVASGSRSAAFDMAGMPEKVIPISVTPPGSIESILYNVDIVRGETLAPTTPPTATDSFGAAVVVNGDTLAVGSPGTTTTSPGKVTIFRRDGSNRWPQEQVLVTPAKALNFGYALALEGSGVGATLYVGAPNDNTAGLSAGAVYVFVRGASGWAQQGAPIMPTPHSGYFGASLALSGDTLAIGAPLDGSNAMGVNGDPSNDLTPNSGAAFVFDRTNGSWQQSAYLKASNTGNGDHFGDAIAIDGDTIAVGATLEDSDGIGVNDNAAQSDNSAMSAGAVYVFYRSAKVWAQQAYVKASNTNAGDLFGYALGVSGDMLAVTAPLESSKATGVDGDQTDNSAQFAGAAYFFTRSGTTWIQREYIKASYNYGNARFGWSLSLTPNVLAIGAQLDPSTPLAVDGIPTSATLGHRGGVYVFGLDPKSTTGLHWTQVAAVKAYDSVSTAFGGAVALDTDLLAVGAPSVTGIAGAAYTYAVHAPLRSR